MICSVHFQGGVGYCKAYPVPTISNDPAIALRLHTNTTKRKAPRARSLSVEVKRKCHETVSQVTSTTMNNEREQFPHLEPLGAENGDEHSVADSLVHDFASAVKQDRIIHPLIVHWEPNKLF